MQKRRQSIQTQLNLSHKKKEELKILLQEAWAQIDLDMTKKLVESMQNSLAEVMLANNGPTQYSKVKKINIPEENFDHKKIVHILI